MKKYYLHYLTNFENVKKILWPILFILASCLSDSKNNSDNVLARVHNEYLYVSEIQDIVPPGISVSDSLSLIQNYVNNWISEKLFLKKAEKNLLPEHKEFKNQLEEYRNSLIIYKYESELVKQNLDTVVSDLEIEEYYSNNQGNFQLKNNIVRAYYARFADDFDNLKRVRTFFYSDRPEYRDSLEFYVENYADLFFLDDETWVLFSDVLRFVPIETFNQQIFLENRKKIELQEESYVYFANFSDFRIKEGVSPLSFEKENIRKIILNKRRLTIINNMREEVFQTALEKSEFEIF